MSTVKVSVDIPECALRAYIWLQTSGHRDLRPHGFELVTSAHGHKLWKKEITADYEQVKTAVDSWRRHQ